MDNMERINEADREQTKAMTALGDQPAPTPRRRRSDRYHTSETTEGTGSAISGESPEENRTESPVLRANSETAREISRRFQLEERDAGERGNARGATSRAGMLNAARIRESGRTPDPVGMNPGRKVPGQNQVGYTPGRMGAGNTDRGRMSEESRARLADANRNALRAAYGNSQRETGEINSNGRDNLSGKRYGQEFYGRKPNGRDPRTQKSLPEREAARTSRGGRLLTGLTIALLILGLLLIGIMMIPEGATGVPGTVRALLRGESRKKQDPGNLVKIFSADGAEYPVPTDIVFTIATEPGVTDVRIVDGEGEEIPAARDNEGEKVPSLWQLSWHVEKAWEGSVWLQLKTGGEWMETGRSAEIRVTVPAPTETAAPVSPESVEFTPATEAPAPEKEDAEQMTVITETNAASKAPEKDGEEDTPAPEKAEETEITEGEPAKEYAEAEEADPDALSEETEDEDDPERGNRTTDPGTEQSEEGLTGEEIPENWDGEAPEEGTEENAASENTGLQGQAEPGTGPEANGTGVTAEETDQPKMTVTAAESADPALIATTQIYNGNKKVKEYARSAADQIRMPTLGEYTRTKMGILTFRSDAFRQNAATGTVEGMNELELAWTAEAGSAKGSSGTMYYGVGWVGQPAIVKWSKEVREQSEMYDAKKEKTGLREVIVAGQDGRIYFLDLSDGTATRNSIKLGYPMKGSPSISPSGAPYMTVGQFARKMARGTGTIGLRQYNLYKMKEMTLIDGLDAKNNRPFNNIGSFETSALIDRRTSTLVTAGTNGLLYIIKLNPEFDYAAGVYQQSPTQVVLRTRAKGEKDASTAVEASVAMYDRYVYYADMGGYLRCVDTNSMAVAWAVALGDSVESTPALDWHGTDGLDLYTATELSLRKKGEAEIKCFDALSGEERWSTGIGVQKDKKGKTIAGFRASPVIGQNGLSEYIYYTVNNLNDAGREILNLGGDVDNAVIALRKEDGRIVWSFGLSGRGYSSPVAVYDEKGNGAIIQCAGDGSIVMLDGINGKEKANYQIDGTIEASPAVYNNILVIATTEKNKNNIYGIRIQ